MFLEAFDMTSFNSYIRYAMISLSFGIFWMPSHFGLC